ncbi:Shedu immune nuclease family protein [Aquimarina sp. 2201CG5-10]|uniref:Shedu immune nuclease family protein n=1 Tax=Aquimarina callyspongiae TaxID=3098150 RepID=UPI002AB4BA61|nr:Shedu immune nuclease family protein [Aquimarina sp. 2201CG5-10]MDY8136914.1 Shedu immune nuclease family protein [Aquimarina sp. 2201CG5-10]
MEGFKGEKIKRDLSTKQVFYYYDTEQGIDQLSKEVFKKKDMIIHYPRGFEGGAKYKTIKKFTYIGCKKKFPVGVFKSPSYGYGFTKTLSPFAYYIDENYSFEEVVIDIKGNTKIDLKNKKLHLSPSSLSRLHKAFSGIYKKNKEEIKFLLHIELNALFPKDIKKPDKTYIPNALSTSLSAWGNSIDEFSEDDKATIKDLFDKLSLSTDFLTSTSLAKTKEIVDIKYIASTLKEYNSLLKLTSDGDSLEKKWQAFLKSNSWIFSSIFAQPVILHRDEAYVGGKNLDNQNGKFNDFLIKNSLSDNVSFLEIKTHKTKLLENSSYRGTDVFSVGKDLSGCINQVLNQRDNFQKEFWTLKGKSKTIIESFNSKCVVLIGTLKSLSDEQKYSFELFRSNSRDVEILTFDELKTKIESLQKLMKKK